MTVAVAHWTRSPNSNVRPSSRLEDCDMAYSEVQFSVETMEADKDGNGAPSRLSWEGAMAAETGPAVGAVDDGLLFDEFVDLDSLSTAGGDELSPSALPESFFYMSLPAHESASMTSASDNLEDTPRRSHILQVPASSEGGAAVMAAPTKSARFVAAATLGAAAPPAVQGLGVQSSSWPIDPREEYGQRKFSSYPDTACAGGSESITDSELLRLEDISLKASPSRAHSVVVSHPPTPLLQASSATSSNTNLHHAGGSSSSSSNNTTDKHHTSNGGRKPSNFFKAVASKLQQKAASVRHKQPNMPSGIVDSRGPLSPNVSPRKAFKLRPGNLTGIGGPPTRLPLSPPNSATIPHDLPSSSSAGSSTGLSFVGGHIEDPFYDAVASNSVPMFRRSDPTTPMDTPILDDKGGMFYHHPLMSSGNVANTSKATWPMTTTTPQTESHVAWSSTYGGPDALDNGWWNSANMDLSTSSPYPSDQARNAHFNLAMHTQQGELPYEYNPLAAAEPEMSGLMIHMPPEASSPIIPYQSQQQQLHHHHHHHHQHQQHQQQQPDMTERRPRVPRAPSAGARHLTTPMRKTRNPSRSRDSSTSPTPTNRSRHSSGGSFANLAAGPAIGASVKKRRSWSRRESLRTPSIGSNLGGAASEGVGFVNFTPSDKNILMTGVAPSGSSKTKARREKEAMEKRRRMSEAAIKAVKAAGGDVDKLVEEGFF